MRAAYSTNMSERTLITLLQSAKNEGFNFQRDEFEKEPFFSLKYREECFAVAINNGTIYVDKVGSEISRILEKNKICFSYTQHQKISVKEIEEYFILDAMACE